MAMNAEELLFVLRMRDDASKTLKQAGVNIKDVGVQARAANENFKSAGASIVGLGRSAVVAAGGFIGAAGLIGILKSAVSETEEFRQSQIRLGTILEATQYQSGLTRREINSLVDDLEKATRFDDSDLRDAAAALATFENVGSKAFKETLKSASDLASFMGSDIRSATMALGRALQSPTEGLLALRRAGIAFTQNQRDQIKAMQDAGQTAEAQELILQTLQERIGGLAEDEMAGLTGASNNLKDSWEDLLKELGNSFVYDAAVGGINAIAAAVRALNDAFTPATLDQRIADLQKTLKDNNETLSRTDPAGRIDKFLFGGLAERSKRLTEEELTQLSLAKTEDVLREAGKRRLAAMGEQQAAERALADRAAEEQRKAAEKAAKEAAKAAERIAREREQEAKEALRQQAELFAASVRIADEGKATIQDHIDQLRNEAEATRALTAIQGQSVEQRALSRAMIDAESDARARGFRLTEGEKAAIQDLVAAQQEAAEHQQSFGVGIRDAFENFRDTARDNAALARDAFATAATSMSSAIDRFVETGKFKISEFVRSALADFAKLAANRAFNALLGTALDFAFGSGLPDLGGAGPGIPPVKPTLPSASGRVIRAHHPRRVGYAAGGVAVAGESYRDEGVLPLTRMPSGDLGVQATGAGGGITINNDIDVNVSGQRTPDEAQQIARAVKDGVESTVVRILQREHRPGGLFGPQPAGLVPGFGGKW
jgi:lambda family phage tail tape measure protein